MLRVEDDHRYGETEFLDYRRDHHRPKSDGISCNDKKGELPSEANTDESIEEAGMSDGRGVLAADCVKKEVERGEDKNSPDKSDPENDLGEFHVSLKSGSRPSQRRRVKSR